ncbi:hypothetical protein E2C01_005225 [Portunus trituberculatus]|uniref:Uncharacterized protein n=1 Tax=Portunus trituberculatus TaxID=210409 RepID=A0A5B7CRY9_PORTR|nr:hypothetical protein [Portunus trituberculatus]
MYGGHVPGCQEHRVVAVHGRGQVHVVSRVCVAHQQPCSLTFTPARTMVAQVVVRIRAFVSLFELSTISTIGLNSHRLANTSFWGHDA